MTRTIMAGDLTDFDKKTKQKQTKTQIYKRGYTSLVLLQFLIWGDQSVELC